MIIFRIIALLLLIYLLFVIFNKIDWSGMNYYKIFGMLFLIYALANSIQATF